jgi:hypothetical protein
MHTISYAECMQSVRETQSNIKKVGLFSISISISMKQSKLILKGSYLIFF